MAFFGIDKTRLGAILTAQSVGCIIVSVFLALYGERFNKLRGVTLGLSLMGIAAILIGTMTLYCAPGSGYALLLIYSLLAGVGFIIIDLLMNGVIADIYPDRKNTLLPFLHAMYSCGAMLAPMYVAVLINPEASGSFALPYRFLGLISVVVAVFLFILCNRVTPWTPYADMQEMRHRAKENPAEVFKSPRAWLFLLAGILYLIFQTGLSAWLPSFCTEMLGFDTKHSGLMLTVYFAGVLAMRFASPLIYKKLPVARFYRITLLLSTVVFVLCFLFTKTESAMLLFAACGGLLQGAAVPSLVILCCDAFPGRSASASAIVVLAVSIAAFVGPVALGRIIDASGFTFAMLISCACLPLSVLSVRLALKKTGEQKRVLTD